MSLSAAQHVLGTGRKRFCRHEMEQPGPQRVSFPGGPGDQKIQPQAKTGLQYAPLRLPGPGFRQTAALEENVARLLHAAKLAAVAVAKARTVGAAAGGAVVQPVNALGHTG